MSWTVTKWFFPINLDSSLSIWKTKVSNFIIVIIFYYHQDFYWYNIAVFLIFLFINSGSHQNHPKFCLQAFGTQLFPWKINFGMLQYFYEWSLRKTALIVSYFWYFLFYFRTKWFHCHRISILMKHDRYILQTHCFHCLHSVFFKMYSITHLFFTASHFLKLYLYVLDIL